MLHLTRITAACVSLAYLAVAMIPCAPPEMIAATAALAREAAAAGDHAEHPVADPHAVHAKSGHRVATAPTAHPEHSGHVNHSEHTGHSDAADAPALHTQIASDESLPQLSAPCRCGCSDAPESAGSSSSRVGYALARADWNHALALEPVRHAAILPQPPQQPHLGTDPVPI